MKTRSGVCLVVLGVIATIFYFTLRPESASADFGLISKDGTEQATTSPGSGGEFDGSSGRVESGLDRKDVRSSSQSFVSRWEELLASADLKRRLNEPFEQQLLNLEKSNGPLPFDTVFREHQSIGVVPPPSKSEMLELSLESIYAVTRMFRNQMDSLKTLQLKDIEGWKSSNQEDISTMALRYSPEALAVYILGRDIRDDIVHNDSLRIELQQVRTDSIISYGLVWEDLQYYRHCALQASLDTNTKLPVMDQERFLSSQNPGFSTLLTRLDSLHNHYLQGVWGVLRAAYPEEAF